MVMPTPFESVMTVMRSQFLDEERFRLFESVMADQWRDEPDINRVIRETDLITRGTLVRDWLKPECRPDPVVLVPEGWAHWVKRQAQKLPARLRSEVSWIKEKAAFVLSEAKDTALYVESHLLK